MKTALKILTALAAVAGIVYVVAAYGDKIVEWAKRVFPCGHGKVNLVEDDFEDEIHYAPVKPVEKPAEAPEEAPVEAPAADDGQPVAEDNDFEG